MNADTLRGVADVLDRLDTLDDDTDIACLAAELRTMLDEVASALSRAREHAACTLWRRGASLAEIGAALGVSRQRVHVLVKTAREREHGGAPPVDYTPPKPDERSEYDDYLESLYLAAEEACRGQLVKPEYRDGPHAVDPRRFFWLRGRPPMYAASWELCEYWDSEKTPGTRRPMTYTQWQRAKRQHLVDSRAA